MPADGQDWSAYLDSLFRPSGVLSRLDSAIALAQEARGPAPAPFGVTIMIPYAKRGSDRAAAVQAYAGDVERRFAMAQLGNLRLDGFYWFCEDAPPRDVELITHTAAAVHARGLRFLWIPYYKAANWGRWRELGFDAAWLQPNYFFDPTIPSSRLDSAARQAEGREMGLEVEFDGRLWSDPRFADRLDPYLTTLDRHPGIKARGIAVYEGGGALLHLASSRAPRDRALYDTLDEMLR